ncbi:MAG: hypothetical protein J07HQW1_01042 [Haloquadratum walsbyi J07HQW1]|uniref:Uncharacterized protein n=1 Tax=Haloquadratum walsbyi J07HQW1 TaxID=1238424 RepID=U1PFW3_9EURY|nr:MAG: hypothetical protein J07HQW1_01042 [Haloquadratum walsbyi J07HQW1]
MKIGYGHEPGKAQTESLCEDRESFDESASCVSQIIVLFLAVVASAFMTRQSSLGPAIARIRLRDHMYL